MLSKLLSVFSRVPTAGPEDEVKQIDEAMAYSKALRDVALADPLYANQVGEWFIKHGAKLLQQEREVALRASTQQGKKKAFADSAVGIAIYLAEQEKTRGKGDVVLQAIFLCAHVFCMNGLAYDESPAIVVAAKEAIYRCEGLLIACAGLREQENS